jgi:hypothetical protein
MNHKYAKALGRSGGKASARKLSDKERRERAKRAAQARWGKKRLVDARKKT